MAKGAFKGAKQAVNSNPPSSGPEFSGEMPNLTDPNDPGLPFTTPVRRTGIQLPTARRTGIQLNKKKP